MYNDSINNNKGKTGIVPVPGAMTPTSDEQIIAYTGDIYDDQYDMNQRDINEDLYNKIEEGSEELLLEEDVNVDGTSKLIHEISNTSYTPFISYVAEKSGVYRLESIIGSKSDLMLQVERFHSETTITISYRNIVVPSFMINVLKGQTIRISYKRISTLDDGKVACQLFRCGAYTGNKLFIENQYQYKKPFDEPSYITSAYETPTIYKFGISRVPKGSVIRLYAVDTDRNDDDCEVTAIFKYNEQIIDTISCHSGDYVIAPCDTFTCQIGMKARFKTAATRHVQLTVAKDPDYIIQANLLKKIKELNT